MSLSWHNYELKTETSEGIWESGEPWRPSEMQEKLGTSSRILIRIQRRMEARRMKREMEEEQHAD